VTPSAANTVVKGNSLAVMFSAKESVWIRAQEHDGQLRISATPRLRCERTTPSVNTPTSTNAAKDDHQLDPPRDNNDGNGDGRNGRNGRGRGDH
jgi:hypothetical protein